MENCPKVKSLCAKFPKVNQKLLETWIQIKSLLQYSLSVFSKNLEHKPKRPRPSPKY